MSHHHTRLQTAILKTLAYFDIFDFPLTLEEIETYLLGISADKTAIQATLQTLPTIKSKNGYFFFKNRKALVETRKQKKKLANKLFRKCRHHGYLWQTIPFIKFIAVANNLAFHNPEPTSDIDLFVITSKNRLFTARTLLTFWTQLLGVRRHHQKIAGRFCLSFYITENALDLSPLTLQPSDIYFAYWFHTLKPIFDQNLASKLIEKNTPWFKTYFPNPVHLTPSLIPIKKPLFLIQKILEKMLSGKIGDFIENKLKQWQLKRAHDKKTQKFPAVVITDQILKFHESDRRKTIHLKWEKKLKNFS